MHVPVMLKEVTQALAVQPGGRYIDGTLGGGGHAREILKKSSPGGQLLGIDADPAAISAAQVRLTRYQDATLFVNDNFGNLRDICTKNDFFPVHGILLDLGLSSLQLGATARGFSFQYDAPLDMRFSPQQELTAADIVNQYPVTGLEELIRDYGEERQARRIAEYIVAGRPLNTTLELADVVSRATGGRHGRIHPATRTFQALRIAVNRELEQLEAVLRQTKFLMSIRKSTPLAAWPPWPSLSSRSRSRRSLTTPRGLIMANPAAKTLSQRENACSVGGSVALNQSTKKACSSTTSR